jgi:hypothetical protein
MNINISGSRIHYNRAEILKSVRSVAQITLRRMRPMQKSFSYLFFKMFNVWDWGEAPESAHGWHV